MNTPRRPFDHDPEPVDDVAVDDEDDADGPDPRAAAEVAPASLRELEPDWEADDADVLDQHRAVPLDDDDH